MMAAVLYGKEDLRLERVAGSARRGRGDRGAGGGGADLRDRSEGVSTGISRDDADASDTVWA